MRKRAIQKIIETSNGDREKRFGLGSLCSARIDKIKPHRQMRQGTIQRIIESSDRDREKKFGLDSLYSA